MSAPSSLEEAQPTVFCRAERVIRKPSAASRAVLVAGTPIQRRLALVGYYARELSDRSAPVRTVKRFTVSERAVHWLTGATFVAHLGTTTTRPRSDAPVTLA
jgi:hypothetical protein